MRIDRYVHDERLTWGAASVLLVVTALHAAGIGRLLLTRLETADEAPTPPIFQVSMLKLPPPRLPPEVQQAPDTATDAVKQERPRVTRPVPILVDTPTTNPVPPDTQVKQYEMGDELLPGDPGPAMPEGTVDGDATAAVQQTPVYWKMKLLEMKPPNYPPRCLRLGMKARCACASWSARTDGRRTRASAPAAAMQASTRRRSTPCATGGSNQRSATACRSAHGASSPSRSRWKTDHRIQPCIPPKP